MTSAPPRSEPAPDRRGAHASLRIGTAVTLEASISTSGLLAIAAIVTSAVLGSAAIVRAARRNREAVPRLPHRQQD